MISGKRGLLSLLSLFLFDNVSFFFMSSRFLYFFFVSSHSNTVCYRSVCVCVFGVHDPCLLCLPEDLALASDLLLNMYKPESEGRAFSVMIKLHP